MTRAIRALIVDDEPLARERIRDLLVEEQDVEIVGEAHNGKVALEAVQTKRPNLLFIDVQMPELDGFGLVEALGADAPVAVVFVTAYDEYALKAFEVHAADYLLKPFDRDRFRRTMDHVRAVLRKEEQEDAREQLFAAIQQLRGSGHTDRLMVKAKNRIFFVRTTEIDWIESAGNYIRIHGPSGEHLLRETMGSIEARLDPDRFFRIHRTAIVNLEAVKELQPLFHGECTVVMRDGKRLTLSRGYRGRLEEKFGG